MSPQQTIAHYRITAKPGEGGIAEAWRATDTKLNREGAIKILPDAFARSQPHGAVHVRGASVGLAESPNILSARRLAMG
jgi:serine/threonine-protein kinase